jgi:hypothetical protein
MSAFDQGLAGAACEHDRAGVPYQPALMRYAAHTLRRPFMLRLGKSIRLTSNEVSRLTRVSKLAPVGIKNIDDLENYVNECKEHYCGTSPETQLLHQMIDEEVMLCIVA